MPLVKVDKDPRQQIPEASATPVCIVLALPVLGCFLGARISAFVLVLVLVIVIEETNSHNLAISHLLDYDYDYEHEHDGVETKYAKIG